MLLLSVVEMSKSKLSHEVSSLYGKRIHMVFFGDLSFYRLI